MLRSGRLLFILRRSISGSQSEFVQRSCFVSPPRALLTAFRGIRARNVDSSKTVDDEKKNFSKDGEKEEENEKKDDSPPQLDPEMKRKLRYYLLGMMAVSFGITFYLFTKIIVKNSEANPEVTPQALADPGIDIETFLRNYLQKGEVRKIVFLPGEKKAVATLYDGAIIDGKVTTASTITVATDLTAAQFWAEIRKAEEDLGISISQGVELRLQQSVDLWRVLKLTIGIMILVFLGSQYGRLLANRLSKRPSSTPKDKSG